MMKHLSIDRPRIALDDMPPNAKVMDEELAMRAREREVNEALHRLDDDHRLRRIQRDEYQQRRRTLLESLHADDGEVSTDTVRRSVKANGADEILALLDDAPRDGDTATSQHPAAKAMRPIATYAVLLGVVVGVMLVCLIAFGG